MIGILFTEGIGGESRGLKFDSFWRKFKSQYKLANSWHKRNRYLSNVFFCVHR